MLTSARRRSRCPKGQVSQYAQDFYDNNDDDGDNDGNDDFDDNGEGNDDDDSDDDSNIHKCSSGDWGGECYYTSFDHGRFSWGIQWGPMTKILNLPLERPSGG
jgi:hypothetical protein